MWRSGALAAVLVLALCASARAQADDDDDGEVTTRVLRFEEKNAVIQTTLSFPDLIDRELVSKLKSGFVTTVVLRAYVYRDRTEKPITLSVVTIQAAYDLWDEVYVIRIRDPRGELNFKRKTREEAIRDLTTVVQLPLVPSVLVPPGINHFLAVIIEVNPVSDELLAEVRRWLSRPNRSRLGGADAFFGSFVSIFVNPKVAQADRALRFRSQPFYRPKDKPKAPTSPRPSASPRPTPAPAPAKAGTP